MPPASTNSQCTIWLKYPAAPSDVSTVMVPVAVGTVAVGPIVEMAQFAVHSAANRGGCCRGHLRGGAPPAWWWYARQALQGGYASADSHPTLTLRLVIN